MSFSYMLCYLSVGGQICMRAEVLFDTVTRVCKIPTLIHMIPCGRT